MRCLPFIFLFLLIASVAFVVLLRLLLNFTSFPFGNPEIKTIAKIAISHEKDSVLTLVYVLPSIVEGEIQVRKVHKKDNKGRVLHFCKYTNHIDTFYVKNETELMLVVRDSTKRYQEQERNKPIRVKVDFGK